MYEQQKNPKLAQRRCASLYLEFTEREEQEEENIRRQNLDLTIFNHKVLEDRGVGAVYMTLTQGSTFQAEAINWAKAQEETSDMLGGSLLCAIGATLYNFKLGSQDEKDSGDCF